MTNKTNLGIGAVVGLLVIAYLSFHSNQQNTNISTEQTNQNSVKAQVHQTESDNDSQQGLAAIQHAYDHKLSNIQVQALGHVKAILRDDNEGSRHQKFILALDNGITVLVAHNIDLSPRLEHLKKGDMVDFYGEYEYSHQGGVIHWTHHDPQKKHPDGWLKHTGQIYQ